MNPHPAIAFLQTFLHSLQQKDVLLASLRYKPIDEQNAFSGDYDYITNAGEIDTVLETLFDLAIKHTINFTINRVKYGKCMIYIYSPLDNQKIILEIWSYLDVKSSNTLGYLFFEDINQFIEKKEDGVYILKKRFEALYYLSHLKSKNKKLEVALIQTRLHHYKKYLQEDNSDIREFFEILLKEPERLNEVAELANDELVKMSALYKPEDSKKRKQEAALRLKISKHRIFSQVLKKVKVIPVVGPDGVGKTTLIEGIKKQVKSKVKYYRFKSLFRHNIFYQLSAKYFRSKLPKTIEKNQYDDLYGSLIISIASWRYIFLAMFAFFGKKFYFSDRFFHDFIIQDTRFLDKKAKLRENYRELLQKTPRTYWFLHLDAPTDVILARKDELNAEAIESYRQDIFTLYLHKPSRIYTYINTSKEIQRCVEQILDTAQSLGMKKK